jgi:hypothetical protein
MKRICFWTISMVLSLSVLSNAAAALAQITPADVQRYRQEVYPTQIKPDIPAADAVELRSAWAVEDADLVPFLGRWATAEGSVTIYPSQSPNQVCVIVVSPTQSAFAQASLADDQLQTGSAANRPGDFNYLESQIFFRTGDFLVWGIEENDRKLFLPLVFAGAPMLPADLLPEKNARAAILQQYDEAGCRATP